MGRSKGIAILVFLGLIVIGIYFCYHYSIFKPAEEQKPKLPTVTIFYDGTNESTIKGAFDLESIIGGLLEVRMVNVTSGQEMLKCFNESNKNISDIVVWFMHGNQYGMGIGNLTGYGAFFTWKWVTEWVKASNHTHFLFGTCYSASLTFYCNETYRIFVPPYETENISKYTYTNKINLSYNCTELLYDTGGSKSLYTFAGEVDYKVIVIYSAEEINRIVRKY